MVSAMVFVVGDPPPQKTHPSRNLSECPHPFPQGMRVTGFNASLGAGEVCFFVTSTNEAANLTPRGSIRTPLALEHVPACDQQSCRDVVEAVLQAGMAVGDVAVRVNAATIRLEFAQKNATDRVCRALRRWNWPCWM